MPAEEFDAYLRALGSLLRLKREQRAELADEFRDHLETRLEELTAAGVPRSAAVETALEEFGDAAGLASHFTSLARRRRVHLVRRVLMRFTLTAAALAAVGAFLWLLAPPNPVFPPPGAVVAQDEAGAFDDPLPDEQPAEKVPAEDSPEGQRTALTDPSEPDAAKTARVNAALAEPSSLEGIRPGDSVADALDALTDRHQITILPDRSALELEGLELGDLVLENPPGIEGYSLRTTLKVLLEDLAVPLTAVPRDGYLSITTQTEAATILDTRIYNVRDLLADVQPKEKLTRPDHDLVEVVESVTGGPDHGGAWGGVQRGPGTIEHFDGLLAVRQTAAVHRQIEELLAALRATGAERGWDGAAGAGALRGGADGILDVDIRFPAGARGREPVARRGLTAPDATVAVVCDVPDDIGPDADSGALAADLAEAVSRDLAERGVRVRNPRETARRSAGDLNFGDPAEVAAALDCTHVVRIRLSDFRLRETNGVDLLRGRAAGTVTLYGRTPGAAEGFTVFSRPVGTRYPRSAPRAAGSQSVKEFRREFLNRFAGEIVRAFGGGDDEPTAFYPLSGRGFDPGDLGAKSDFGFEEFDDGFAAPAPVRAARFARGAPQAAVTVAADGGLSLNGVACEDGDVLCERLDRRADRASFGGPHVDLILHPAAPAADVRAALDAIRRSAGRLGFIRGTNDPPQP